MIQNHPLLEDLRVGPSACSMSGAERGHTGVYMKPVYNLSSLCLGQESPPPSNMVTDEGNFQQPHPHPPLHTSHPHHYSPHHSPHQLAGYTGPGAASPIYAGIGLAARKPRVTPVISDPMRCKRRVDLAYKTHPTAVARRNERERNRVKHINSTFATLRQHIPCASKNKKMSKVETLRSAIRYIHHLQHILDTQKAAQQEDHKHEEKPAGSVVRSSSTAASCRTLSGGQHVDHSRQGRTAARGFSNTTSTSLLASVSHIELSCEGLTQAPGSTVLLSPPGSPDSVRSFGPPGSEDSDLSPGDCDRYYGKTMEEDDEEEDMEEEEHDLTQFADWF